MEEIKRNISSISSCIQQNAWINETCNNTSLNLLELIISIGKMDWFIRIFTDGTTNFPFSLHQKNSFNPIIMSNQAFFLELSTLYVGGDNAVSM